MAPLVIALTGGIGSGKSSVADMLAKLGAAVIDTDEIAHRLTAPAQPGARAIGKEFGAEFLAADGALDRKRMRELVFADPAAKTRLEALLHPMIRTAVNAQLMALKDATTGGTRAPYIVIVVPLLIETGAYRELAKRVLVVDCDEQLQIERVSRRSALTAEAVRRIMANQVSRAERIRNANDIVTNDGDLHALGSAVKVLHGKYVELARNSAATE
jgi:dephospho-CoA kinase